MAPDDTKPYIMRVVVIPSTAGSAKTTIRRQIWIPGKKLRKQSKHFIHFGQRCSHQYKVQQKIVLGTTFCVYMLSQSQNTIASYTPNFTYLWQFRVEIEGYSVVYFDRIAAFEASYR